VGETLSSGTGASGAAVAHVLRGGDSPVTVKLDGPSPAVQSRTDSRGRARLVLIGKGRAVVAVTAESFTPASREVEISGGSSAAPEVFELAPPTPCSGVCDLSRTDHASVEHAYLVIDVAGKQRHATLSMAELRGDGSVPFEIRGMGPGSYTARISLDGTLSDPIPFELPPGGSADLVLRHP